MGEIQNQPFRLSFNASLKVDFQGSRLTSDGAPAGRDARTRRATRVRKTDEVRLWLSVIAYKLGNLWRRLYHPKSVEGWSFTSLQQRLVKTGGRRLKYAQYYWLLLAEGVAALFLDSSCASDTRQPFGGMVCEAFELSRP
jgi:hypothetical protein